MDDQKRKLSPTVSNSNQTDSPRISEKIKHDESRIINPLGSNIEQKLENFRMRLRAYTFTTEQNSTTKPMVTEPLKPMRYVCRYNVAVSLKKSRLSRFFKYYHSFLVKFNFLKISLFNNSRPNANIKQWLMGKRQFNENPKEVNRNNNKLFVKKFQMFVFIL